MLSFILDIIAPKKCYSCKKEWHFLCNQCYTKIKDFEPLCYVCKNLSKNFAVCPSCKADVFYDKVLVLKHYRSQNFWRIIKQAKFYGIISIFDELALKMKELFLDNQKVRKYEDFLIISVPSPFRRKFKRGYNSSEVLAKKFAKTLPIPYKNLCKKAKYTPQQSKLSREKRLTNLYDSFIIKNSKAIQWKKIIIIDDVVSTGSTINELARVLKNHGASEVIAFCLASN